MSLTTDADMKVTILPMSEILFDQEFNTRERISPMDVVDLAQSIDKDGLQSPVIVRRTPDGPKPYSLVAGFRRFTAYTVLNRTEIPTIIREGLTEFQARTINVIENLKRKDLNMLEEANCLRHYRDAGYNREEIAREMKLSPGWVQVRLMVLDFPPEIQVEVSQGTYSSTQIRDLYKLKNKPDEQMLAARKLKEAKAKGENKTADQVLKKAPKANAKKQRTQAEIRAFMMFYKDTFRQFDFLTRTLAWCTGEINNADLYASMKEEADRRGIPFQIPELDYLS